MRHRYARLGQQLLQALALRLYRRDVVVQEIYLAATLQFAQAGLADQARRVGRDEGLDRQAPLRRGGDHRQVAQALERHRERARDRRRSEREYVHLGAQRLQRFLLAHAEAVLLVHDHQAQPRELHVAREQLVGADRDIDLSAGDALQRGGGFLAGAKARQLGELHREIGEAIREGLEVLLREQRGRREYGDLHAVCDRDERGAQRHLGLAEADVAADQPVHRLALAHVFDHCADRALLVGRGLEAEALGEGLQIVLDHVELPALAQRALRVNMQQFGRGVAHRARGLALGLVPDFAAEFVYRRRFRRSARVAADQIELRDRHIELVRVGVFEQQEFRFAFAEVEVDQAAVAADAVLQMHHRVARAKFGEVAQHALDRGLARAVAAFAGAGRARVQLRLGDDGEAFAIEHEAVQQRSHREAERSAGGEEFGVARGGLGLQCVLGQILRERFAASGGLGDEQRASDAAGQERLQPVQRIGGAALDGHLGHGCDRDAGLRRVLFGALDVHACKRARRDEEGLGAEEQLARRHERPRAVAKQELVARLRVAPEIGERGVHVVMHHQRGFGGQIIEQRRGGVEKERQVVLDAGRRDAVAHVLVYGALGGVALEGLAKTRAEAGAAGIVHWKLARRQQAHVVHLVDGALRIDVESADRVDDVVLEVDAVGQRAAHREQIDQAAAHAVLARRDDLGQMLVAGQRELRAQFVDIELAALLEKERIGREVVGGREAVERGRRRHDDDVELAALQLVERRHALGDQVVVRREAVVGQRFPVGKQRHLEIRREPGDLLAQPLRVGRLRAQHRDRARAGRQPGERERVARAVQPRRDAFSARC